MNWLLLLKIWKIFQVFCFRLIWPNIRFISAIDKYIRYHLFFIPVMTKIGVSKSSVASLWQHESSSVALHLKSECLHRCVQRWWSSFLTRLSASARQKWQASLKWYTLYYFCFFFKRPNNRIFLECFTLFDNSASGRVWVCRTLKGPWVICFSF